MSARWPTGIFIGFPWWDWRIGITWVARRRLLYVMPLPMVCIGIEFGALR